MSDYLEAEKSARGNDLKKWLSELSRAEKEDKSWFAKARKIVKRYRDDDRPAKDGLPSRYNILWSNTQTIAPTLYSRTPKVQVDRRFKDQDPVGRVASFILERAAEYSIQAYDFDSVMKAVRDDYMLAGRGTAWVRYEPEVVDDQITYQQVFCDYVHWSDFIHSPAKQWPQVRWVARWIYLNRRQLVDRFGSNLGKQIKLDYAAGEDRTQDQSEGEDFKQARICEIWDSDAQQVIWLSKSYPNNILEAIPDPLGLKNFFPTPKPWFATMTTDQLVPVPDFVQYQDQATELDDITTKICLLVDALRVVGVYNAEYPVLQKLLTGTRNNELVPVANWMGLQQGGGIKGAVEFMSIAEIADALIVLYQARDKVKGDLYEITGIADIIRGNSSPSETATAQQIKGQFATLRISDRQREAQRYARDLISLHAEIIAEHFTPQSLALMSGVQVANPDVQQMFYAAIQLLRNDALRSFRIDIETDSMVAVDEALDKQNRSEFVHTMTSMLEAMVKLGGVMPAAMPMLGEALMFLCRGYSAGRNMEASIESTVQAMQQAAQQSMQQAQNPQPDPAQAAAQGQLQLAQIELQMKQQAAQQKFQLDSAAMQHDTQFKQASIQLDAQKAASDASLNAEKIRGDYQVAALKAQGDLELRSRELENYVEIETKKALVKANPIKERATAS